MDKEDTKVLIHAALALVVIFGGFAIFEIYGSSSITGRTVSVPESLKEAACLQISSAKNIVISDENSCCNIIKQADRCELLDGSMDIGYNNDVIGEPKNKFKADYVCTNKDQSKLYFDFNIYEHCELAGYRIVLN